MTSFGIPFRAAAAAIGMVLATGGVTYGAFQLVSSSPQAPALAPADATTSETPGASETESPEATETESPEATETETPKPSRTETPKPSHTATATYQDDQGEDSDEQGEDSDEQGESTSPTYHASQDSQDSHDSED